MRRRTAGEEASARRRGPQAARPHARPPATSRLVGLFRGGFGLTAPLRAPGDSDLAGQGGDPGRPRRGEPAGGRAPSSAGSSRLRGPDPAPRDRQERFAGDRVGRPARAPGRLRPPGPRAGPRRGPLRADLLLQPESERQDACGGRRGARGAAAGRPVPAPLRPEGGRRVASRAAPGQEGGPRRRGCPGGVAGPGPQQGVGTRGEAPRSLGARG